MEMELRDIIIGGLLTIQLILLIGVIINQMRKE